MRPEAVAFDLDDTLLRDDLTISPQTLRLLRELAARGVSIIPASSRTCRSMWPYVEQLGCARCIISSGGAELWSPAGDCLHRITIPVQTAQEILAFARERELYCQTYDEGGYLYDRDGPQAEAYRRASSLQGRKVSDLAAALMIPRTKILIRDDPERIDQLSDEAVRCFGGRVQVTRTKPHFLEFNGAGASKGNALKSAADRFGFRMENTVAFGDSYNDLSMLEAVGLGVAMANARPAVRVRMRYICGTNNNDGVARYLQDLYREEGNADG